MSQPVRIGVDEIPRDWDLAERNETVYKDPKEITHKSLHPFNLNQFGIYAPASMPDWDDDISVASFEPWKCIRYNPFTPKFGVLGATSLAGCSVIIIMTHTHGIVAHVMPDGNHDLILTRNCMDELNRQYKRYILDSPAARPHAFLFTAQEKGDGPGSELSFIKDYLKRDMSLPTGHAIYNVRRGYENNFHTAIWVDGRYGDDSSQRPEIVVWSNRFIKRFFWDEAWYTYQ